MINMNFFAFRYLLLYFAIGFIVSAYFELSLIITLIFSLPIGMIIYHVIIAIWGIFLGIKDGFFGKKSSNSDVQQLINIIGQYITGVLCYLGTTPTINQQRILYSYSIVIITFMGKNEKYGDRLILELIEKFGNWMNTTLKFELSLIDRDTYSQKLLIQKFQIMAMEDFSMAGKGDFIPQIVEYLNDHE